VGGGKRQLLPQLRRFYPRTFARYIEPFVGSGAVFLDLHNTGRLAGKEVRLSDINADVIGCYRMVRDSVEAVIDHLRLLEDGHLTRGSEQFYEVRDARFNAQRRVRGAGVDGYTPELAAMLIYLNRTGYNGLFRVNSLGEFNVPAGRHTSLTICDADNLLLSRALARPASVDVRLFGRRSPVRASAISSTSIRHMRRSAGPPTSRPTPQRRSAPTNRRSAADRHRDREARRARAEQLVAPEIRQLYAESLGSACRFKADRQARRAINSRVRRGPCEYLISNVRPTHL
jgi:hypothetical protein